MPKKKNSHNRKFVAEEERKMVYADEQDGMQLYGIITKTLGNAFFTVYCSDAISRRCKARSRRLRVGVDTVVLVSLREFQTGVGDIIYKYTSSEVNLLKRDGRIPNNFCDNGVSGGFGNGGDGGGEEDVFDFDEI